MWKVGIASTVITPQEPMWLSGYGSARLSEGTRHDLWVKAMALEDAQGKRAVVVTSDLVGLCKDMYERLCSSIESRHGLDRSHIMITSTHNHCAPVTTDVLPDYYPLDAAGWEMVDEYTQWLEPRILQTVDEALSRLSPARLSAGEGTCTFAGNRRNNSEAEAADMLAKGIPLKGPVDHSVPILAVHDPEGNLLAVMFGYACHPTTLSDLQWCGDYPGYAMIEVEKAHPGATALFWTGCGGDQNPLPRRSVELCEKYGAMLARGVEEGLQGQMRPIDPEVRCAFEFVPLQFDRAPTAAELKRDAAPGKGVRTRWAQRMIRELEAGKTMATGCPYGVQVWRLGADQLWIALGAEAVVDYSLRFKQEYGPQTWVCGYAHDMVGYVPSRRVWDEGGYEAEYVYEYGWLAYRFSSDIEDLVAGAVGRLVKQVNDEP